jgi:hypothetical protein
MPLTTTVALFASIWSTSIVTGTLESLQNPSSLYVMKYSSPADTWLRKVKGPPEGGPGTSLGLGLLGLRLGQGGY